MDYLRFFRIASWKEKLKEKERNSWATILLVAQIDFTKESLSKTFPLGDSSVLLKYLKLNEYLPHEIHSLSN